MAHCAKKPKTAEFDKQLHQRTLRFAVSVASQAVSSDRCLVGGQAYGDAYFFSYSDGGPVDIPALTEALSRLVANNDPISRVTKPWAVAKAYFDQRKMVYSSAILATRVSETVDLHECAGQMRLALFPLLDNVGQLSAGTWKLEAFEDGLLAIVTDTFVPQPSIVGSFKDHLKWSTQHKIMSVGQLNQVKVVERGQIDYALHAEFRQESKLAAIVDAVVKRGENPNTAVRLICVAGPTSSGKTTFATKLSMYLKNAGYHAVPMTVDHYYLPLDRQPKYQARQQRSDVDYDSIEAMDVDLVGEHMNALMDGQSVMTPVYNMKTGYRDPPGKHFDALPPDGILVIEGIHALNPEYTKAVDNRKVFRIYISPLSCLQLDEANAIKTTYHRLLRRMSRDYLFRGHSAEKTLSMWNNVRKGEGTWIFPHQNNVDFVMNSAMEYEICVLKTLVEPLLRAVPPDFNEYARAKELLTLIELFNTWPSQVVPARSILREFIGDGAFDVH